jgi:multicomponent Na+:H+ antiporter subunit F
MIGVVLFVLILCICIITIRMIIAPTLWDRLLIFNVISTKVILIIVCLSFIYKDIYFLDISLTYALLGFCGTVLIARFIERRDHL